MKQKNNFDRIKTHQPGDSDETLVRLTIIGDLTAYEKIVRRYQIPLQRHALRYLPREEDAADIVQDAMLSAYKSLGRFDTTKSFKPWIYKIVTNKCLDFLRKQNRTSALTWEMEDINAEEPADRLERESRKKELLQALERLPKRYQLPITGFYFYNLSYRQLSEALSLPVSTIKTHLNRGKILLRKLLPTRLYEK